MLEHITVKIWKFARYINEKIKKALFKKVVYQTFWLIGYSQS